MPRMVRPRADVARAARAWPVVMLAAVLTVASSLPGVDAVSPALRAPLGAVGVMLVSVAALMLAEHRRRRPLGRAAAGDRPRAPR